MLQPRRVAVLAIGVAAAMFFAAPVASVSAANSEITGTPLHVVMDGSGHLQARFEGYTAGELAPANQDLAVFSGMTFTLLREDSSGLTASWCGAAGSPVTPVSGPTAPTGAGTIASPYEMSTSYRCDGPDATLDITQTFSYVNGDSGFAARYRVTNVRATSATFRATSRGLFATGGSARGQGFFEETAPRTIGIFNDAQGSDGGFEEALSTPWSSFVEGWAFQPPDSGGENDFFGPGLDNTVDDSMVDDPRVAVRFDRYRTVGLASGASASFDVDWFFDHYNGLSLAPTTASHPVGQAQAVTATSLNDGRAVAAGSIRYAISGANASSGTVITGADGTATITWRGSQPGEDTLSAYIDTNGNGVYDPTVDTLQTGTFSWTGSASPPPAPPPPPAATQPPAAPQPPRRKSIAVVSAKAHPGGTIMLILNAPRAGSYRAVAETRTAAKRKRPYGRGHASAARAGRVTLTIRPSTHARRRLTSAATKVAITVTFKPTHGDPYPAKHLTVLVKAKKQR